MLKKSFPKPGNFLYPVPAVMVSLLDADGKPNIITVAWAGTVCSDPPMVSISVRKNRHSHAGLLKNREFVINLTSRGLVHATDYCGVRSGRDVDKFQECGLTPIPSESVKAPSIQEAPVHIECKVTQVLELGTHDMFLAEVTRVRFDENLLDKDGRFHMEKADLVAYSHGSYYSLGELLGTFGYSVRKKSSERGGRPPYGRPQKTDRHSDRRSQKTGKHSDYHPPKSGRHSDRRSRKTSRHSDRRSRASSFFSNS